MIRLKDLFQDFLNFWDAAQGKSREEQLRLWQELYESKHPDVFGVYFSPPHWGTRERLPEAFTRYGEDFGSIIERAKAVNDLVPQTMPRALAAFDINEEDVDLDLVLMVGVYTASGFSFPLNNKVGVFLALEHMPRKRESALVLIAHELSHGIQFAVFQQTDPHAFSTFMEDPLSLFTRLDVRLFVEGLGISASKRIAPGSDERTYHLSSGAKQWEWCQANRERLMELTLRGLEGDQQYAYSELFGFGEQPKELSFPQTGYYVGYLAIEKLLDRYTFRQLAETAPGEYAGLICKALRQG